MNPAPDSPALDPPPGGGESDLAAKYRSPAAKVPDWLIWLYPELADIGENPLFIRLAGQGYGKEAKRFRPRLPMEFSRPRGRPINYVGALPILLLASPFMLGYGLSVFEKWRLLSSAMEEIFIPLIAFSVCSFIIGAVLLPSRAIGISGASAARRFIRNGVNEPWGDALALALLDPADYDRAIFSAGAIRDLRSTRSSLVVLALLLSGIAFVMTWTSRGSNNQFGAANQIIVGFLLFSFPLLSLAADISLIGMIGSILYIKHACRLSGKVPRAWFAHEAEDLTIYIATHLPGMWAAYIWFRMLSEMPRSFASWPGVFVAMSFAAVIYFGINGFIALKITRSILRKSLGNYGRAFEIMVRKKSEG
ncbi:hypothetical protein HY256_03720 [Candidatus Sumerlaeota bacterium]|nr:hypothetical protein [Candidatus Sumerlaeota bacterium]